MGSKQNNQDQQRIKSHINKTLRRFSDLKRKKLGIKLIQASKWYKVDTLLYQVDTQLIQASKWYQVDTLLYQIDTQLIQESTWYHRAFDDSMGIRRFDS